MELLLNILWMLIALGGLAVWRVRWTHQPRRRRYAPWREWTAFTSALVMLFFVVSLTDDLHAELIVFEDCSTSRRHVACLAAAHESQKPGHFVTGPGFAVMPASHPSAHLTFEPLFVSVPDSFLALPGPPRRSGRAPPVEI